jgi:hypothetical protein
MSAASQNGMGAAEVMRTPATLLCYWLGAISGVGAIDKTRLRQKAQRRA